MRHYRRLSKKARQSIKANLRPPKRQEKLCRVTEMNSTNRSSSYRTKRHSISMSYARKMFSSQNSRILWSSVSLVIRKAEQADWAEFTQNLEALCDLTENSNSARSLAIMTSTLWYQKNKRQCMHAWGTRTQTYASAFVLFNVKLWTSSTLSKTCSQSDLRLSSGSREIQLQRHRKPLPARSSRFETSYLMQTLKKVGVSWSKNSVWTSNVWKSSCRLSTRRLLIWVPLTSVVKTNSHMRISPLVLPMI